MAIDTPTKRASVLVAGSFFPGRIGLPVAPDGSGADSKAERSFFGYHYAGIDADAPIPVVIPVGSRQLRGVGL